MLRPLHKASRGWFDRQSPGQATCPARPGVSASEATKGGAPDGQTRGVAADHRRDGVRARGLRSGHRGGHLRRRRHHPDRNPEPGRDRPATAAAIAQQTAAAGTPAVDIAALGDVNRGRSTFGTYCANCHTPGGTVAGPDLLAAGGPGASITLESLKTFLREGTNDHDPGPYQSFDITDRQIGDIAAYILAESGS